MHTRTHTKKSPIFLGLKKEESAVQGTTMVLRGSRAGMAAPGVSLKPSEEEASAGARRGPTSCPAFRTRPAGTRSSPERPLLSRPRSRRPGASACPPLPGGARAARVPVGAHSRERAGARAGRPRRRPPCGRPGRCSGAAAAEDLPLGALRAPLAPPRARPRDAPTRFPEQCPRALLGSEDGRGRPRPPPRSWLGTASGWGDRGRGWPGAEG